ncbi:400_t:CDS:2 [Paraglomus brasilianum]|uniref:400_t:CDS:1 n=1 Tax=Paraglomus brasilianum TaxID=144538 RepID=A0A9N9DQA5_9GLOM|nr:400_t:CDS:2 [Paraglomus brasilianum]
MTGACVPPDLTAFVVNHRNKNVDIDRFWNEVECESLDIDHAKD